MLLDNKIALVTAAESGMGCSSAATLGSNAAKIICNGNDLDLVLVKETFLGIFYF